MKVTQDRPRLPGKELEPDSFSAQTTAVIREQALKKVSRRILPFFFALYVIAYLDRANVAFAKLDMVADLGFSEEVFGFGAGVFFVGYFLLEIPGALIVERWSARLWLARILITWGLITVLTGFVKTASQFCFVHEKTKSGHQKRRALPPPAYCANLSPSFSISFRISQGLTVRCRYCGFRHQRGVFCSRCGFHIYEAWLIERRETIKLYLDCVALYLVLMMYVSL
jgi:hypothetical protein